MNHATILRHSRAHRDAAKRNAKAIAARYITRVTIETSDKEMYRFLAFDLPKGVKLQGSYVSNYGRVQVLIIDIEPWSGFAFDPISPLFTITKTERIRK